jgi:hypothetical protein
VFWRERTKSEKMRGRKTTEVQKSETYIQKVLEEFLDSLSLESLVEGEALSSGRLLDDETSFLAFEAEFFHFLNIFGGRGNSNKDTFLVFLGSFRKTADVKVRVFGVSTRSILVDLHEKLGNRELTLLVAVSHGLGVFTLELEKKKKKDERDRLESRHTSMQTKHTTRGRELA